MWVLFFFHRKTPTNRYNHCGWNGHRQLENGFKCSFRTCRSVKIVQRKYYMNLFFLLLMFEVINNTAISLFNVHLLFLYLIFFSLFPCLSSVGYLRSLKTLTGTYKSYFLCSFCWLYFMTIITHLFVNIENVKQRSKKKTQHQLIQSKLNKMIKHKRRK